MKEKGFDIRRVKICFIHWRLVIGGADSALFDLVTLLDKSKFDITVFVVHPDGEWENKFQNAGIRVEYAYSKFNNNSNIFTKIMYHHQIKCVDVAMSQFGKGLFDRLYKNKFDLIVSYHLHPPYSELGLPSFGKTIKYIHGNVFTNPSFGDTIMHQIDYFPKYDEIICVSEDSKKAFISKTKIQKSVKVCFNPINSERIIKLSNKEIDIQFDVPYICAVGRLSPEKGYLRLIKIHKRLLQEGIRHRLVFVGDGEQRSEMESLIKKLSVSNSVLLLGRKENPYPYMKHSKYLIISSFTEAMPVVAMEALCLGVPIVSSFEPVAELFGDEVCGLTTSSDDVSLYNGMKKMLTDDSFYNLSKRSACKRSSFFSSERMIKEVENLYLELL